ncbi:hypothetical protein ABT364_18870 [Massilia sp. SR12]
MAKWMHDGTLLEVDKIEAAWDANRQAVDAARERGDIFSVYLSGRHWYPSEALKFERTTLAAINYALAGIDPSHKFLFLLRKHGGLGGQTPANAVTRSITLPRSAP